MWKFLVKKVIHGELPLDKPYTNIDENQRKLGISQENCRN